MASPPRVPILTPQNADVSPLWDGPATSQRLWACGGIYIAASLACLWVLEGKSLLPALMCWMEGSRSSERWWLFRFQWKFADDSHWALVRRALQRVDGPRAINRRRRCPRNCPCQLPKLGLGSQQQPNRWIEELIEVWGFARKNDDGRNADRRLATVAFLHHKRTRRVCHRSLKPSWGDPRK